MHCSRKGINPENRFGYDEWYRCILLDTCGVYTTVEANGTDDYEKLMLAFWIIIGDDKQIDYWVKAPDRRMIYVIEKQFIPDLEYLTQQAISWDYIKGICTQAGIPSDMNDCPADLLKKILQMVDTHIRRLAKKEDIALIDLPSGYFRRGYKPAAAKAKFRHDHHHHVTHETEHAHA